MADEPKFYWGSPSSFQTVVIDIPETEKVRSKRAQTDELVRQLVAASEPKCGMP